jgi:hypothetical protein
MFACNTLESNSGKTTSMEQCFVSLEEFVIKDPDPTTSNLKPQT